MWMLDNALCCNQVELINAFTGLPAGKLCLVRDWRELGPEKVDKGTGSSSCEKFGCWMTAEDSFLLDVKWRFCFV